MISLAIRDAILLCRAHNAGVVLWDRCGPIHVYSLLNDTGQEIRSGKVFHYKSSRGLPVLTPEIRGRLRESLKHNKAWQKRVMAAQ